LAIYKSIKKRKINNILNITIDNLEIFIILRIELTLIYKIVDSYIYDICYRVVIYIIVTDYISHNHMI